MKALAANCGVIARRFVFIGAWIISGATLLANPKGGQVTNGAITITEGAGTMTINQATPRGIIHWQDFSIGAGELTQFVHLDAKSATLNRVVGGIPSSIQGTLQANGQVYLVNPNGIVVGPGGRINTAAFVASTLDVPDAEFMAGGNMHFSGNSLQGVVNLGSITATDGDVILMAHTVTNAGTINAPNGVAALAAGNDILLQAAGDERVVVNSGIAAGGDGVVNSGTIQAAQAELKAAGGNVYALAVNNSGVIRATGIAQKNGRIILGSAGGVVQNTGELHAKNADGSGGSVRMDSGKGGQTINQGLIDAAADNKSKNGGTVEVLGDTVTVGSSSVIDVSGATAGTVAIGVSADIANQTTATGGIATLTADPSVSSSSGTGTSAAQQATIQANSRILANSTNAGNGGRVVVWSEHQSTVGGTIEAKGGDAAGDGGLVETSGRTGLTIIPGTKVDTSAPKGKAGTWLLDPAGISVDATATDADVTNYSSPTSTSYSQNALSNHVLATDVLDALRLGNVVIDTVNSSPFPNTYANKDIEINAALAIDNTFPTSTLALNSAGGTAVNATIGSATSNVILTMLSHGDININSGGSIQMNGVSLTAITGNINVADQIIALNNKNIFLTASTGSIAFTGSGLAGTSGAGTVTLDTHLSSAGTITSGSSSAVSAGKLVIASGTQGVGTSGSPFVTAVDDLSAIVFRVPSNAASGGGVYIKNTSGGTLHLGNVLIPIVAGFGGAEIDNTSGTILLDNSVPGDHIAVPGNIKLTAGGASGDIKVLNTNSNSINSHSGSVTLIAGRNVQIGDAGTNTWGVWVMGQTNVDVQAGGDVSVAGSVLKAGGASGLSVTAGGDVNILTSNTFTAIMGTSGNVPINITTGAGKTFNNTTTSNGGVLTKLADNFTGTLATGGNIFINADKVVINAPINAGTGSTVVIAPVTASRAFDLGTGDPSKLSFNGSAEINEVKADTLIIGGFTATGDMRVSANISPLSTKTLTLLTQGNVTLNQSILMYNNAQSFNIASGGSTGISGAGSIDASNVSLIALNGSIVLPSSLKVGTLNFQTNGNALFQSPVNQIGAINATSSNWSFGKQIRVEAMGNLAVNGALGKAGTTTYVYLHPGANNTIGNLTLNSGASITANTPGTFGIDLNIGNGSLINNAGASVLDSPSYTVWQANLYSSLNKEGFIPGTRDTSDKVQFPNSVLADPQVFYYGIVTPPTPPSQSAPSAVPGKPLTLPKDFVLSLPRKYQDALTGSDPGAALRKLSLDDILVLETLVGSGNGGTQQGALARAILQALGLADLVDLVEQVAREKVAAENQRIAEEAARQKAAQQLAAQAALIDSVISRLGVASVNDLFAMRSDPSIVADPRASQLVNDALAKYNQKQLDTLAGTLGYDFPKEWYDALAIPPVGSIIPPASLYSLSTEQLGKLSQAQVLNLLAANGVKLSNTQLTLAAKATLTQSQVTDVLKSGPINNNTIAAVVAAGGGNLTAQQLYDGIVAAGGGNVVSQGGGNVVSQGGGNVVSQGGGNVVSQGGGNVVSQGGGNFVSALAQIVAAGGGNLNMAAIVAAGGGNIVAAGGGNIVAAGGGNILANIAGLIGSDAAGFVNKAKAISNNGSAAISNNGSAAISNNGSALIGHDGASLIGSDGAGILGHNGSALIGSDAAGAPNPAIRP